MFFFSVIIPSYNRAHIIDRAIQGVLNQTFQDFEIIIVDDGSIDNTQEIIKNFSNDLRVKYIYQNNAGVCAARNTGAKDAIGDYLLFLDSDDAVENSWLQDFYDSLLNQSACMPRMMRRRKSLSTRNRVTCSIYMAAGTSASASIH